MAEVRVVPPALGRRTPLGPTPLLGLAALPESPEVGVTMSATSDEAGTNSVATSDT